MSVVWEKKIFTLIFQAFPTLVNASTELADPGCHPSRLRRLPDLRRSESQTTAAYF